MKKKLIATVYAVLAAVVLAAPVVFATFTVQRLCHVIDWSWWIVTAPLWGSALLIVAISLVDLTVISAANLTIRRKLRKGSEV